MTRSQGEMLGELLEKQIVSNLSSSSSKGHKRTQYVAKPTGPDAITIMLETIAWVLVATEMDEKMPDFEA